LALNKCPESFRGGDHLGALSPALKRRTREVRSRVPVLTVLISPANYGRGGGVGNGLGVGDGLGGTVAIGVGVGVGEGEPAVPITPKDWSQVPDP